MKFEMHENMKKIKGTVVLMKKNFFELNNILASVRDWFDEVLGHKVSLQLISAVNIDSNVIRRKRKTKYSGDSGRLRPIGRSL